MNEKKGHCDWDVYCKVLLTDGVVKYGAPWAVVVAASDNRGPGIESSHGQLLFHNYLMLTVSKLWCLLCRS